jgi:hypothetical protein
MQDRVERIVDAEDALDASYSQKVQELADKLAIADQAQREAEEARKGSQLRAREVIEDAHREGRQLLQKVREELAARTGQVEASEADLEQKRRAFDLEKKRIVKRVVFDVAKVTVRVLVGALIGNVYLDPSKSSLVIVDRDLSKSVDDYGIGAYLEKPVAVANLEQNLKEELRPALPPFNGGIEP